MTRVFGVLCFVCCISDFCLGLLCAIEVLLVRRDLVLKFLTCILWLCTIFGVLVVESCLHSFYNDFKDLRKVGGGPKMMMVFICFGTLFDVFSQDMVY